MFTRLSLDMKYCKWTVQDYLQGIFIFSPFKCDIYSKQGLWSRSISFCIT